MSVDLRDPIITKYIDLIKSKTNNFKVFYYGDPVRIPTSSLPAVIISRRQTQTSTLSSTEDQHKMALVFTVVTDVRNDIQDDKTLVPGNTSLYDFMEGRDPTTYQLKPECLLNILRNNVNIDPSHQIWTDIDGATKIDYGLVMNKRMPESWSIEGTITAVVSLVQTR